MQIAKIYLLWEGKIYSKYILCHGILECTKENKIAGRKAEEHHKWMSNLKMERLKPRVLTHPLSSGLLFVATV
jgi:hypothetical protein